MRMSKTKLLSVLIIGLFIGTSLFPLISASIDNKKNPVRIKEQINDKLEVEKDWYHILKLDQVDQQQTGSCGWGICPAKNSLFAQGFTPTLNKLTRIKLYLFYVGDPPDDFRAIASIRSSLYENDLVSKSISLPQSNVNWYEFNFPDIDVSPGHQYFIVCKSNYNFTKEFSLCWVFNDNDPYKRGDAWSEGNNGIWYLMDRVGDYYDNDFCFITYGENEQSNQPPYTPTNPSPTNYAQDVSVTTDLSWDSGDRDTGDKLYFEVYFGTVNLPPYIGTTNSYPATQGRYSYDLDMLEYNTKYYWKIIAYDNTGLHSVGYIWEFTTRDYSNNNPYVTINYPKNGDIVSDIVEIRGQAWDYDGNINYVEVSIDGSSWVKAKTSNSWEDWTYNWDTAKHVDGECIIYAKSFDGLDYSNIVETNVEIYNSENIPPIAKILGINPSVITQGDIVYFSGEGHDSDGYITEYYWSSNIDGELNNNPTFSTSELSVGTHEIDFWVRDNCDKWTSADPRIIKVTQTNNKIFHPSEFMVIPPKVEMWGVSEAEAANDQSGYLAAFSAALAGQSFGHASHTIQFYQNEPCTVRVIAEYKSVGGKTSLFPGMAISLIGLDHYFSPDATEKLKIKKQEWKEIDSHAELIDIISGISWFIPPLHHADTAAAIVLAIVGYYNAYDIQNKLNNNDAETHFISTELYLPKGYNAINFYVHSESIGLLLGMGSTIRLGSLYYIRIEDTILSKQYSYISNNNPLSIISYGPVELSIEDPAKRTINHSLNNIPESLYLIMDKNNDTIPENSIVISNPINGTYKINVIENIDSNTNDNFSILIIHDDDYYLVENQLLSDIENTYDFNIFSSNPPYISLDFPIGDETIKNNITINWTVHDYEDGNDLLIDIFYSTDDGYSWNTLKESVNNNDEGFQWDSKTIPDGIYIFKIQTKDSDNNIVTDFSQEVIINNNVKNLNNRAPIVPLKPTGENKGKIYTEHNYSSSSYDINDDQIWFKWNWGDGTNSGWVGPYYSNETVIVSHIWNINGDYEIRLKAKDSHGLESEWSDTLKVTMPKYHSYNPILQRLLKMLERFPFLHYLFQDTS